jgi:2-amino-4-hydroxy-6-hydroxymethyldihydropteridine diphosphokinase
LNAVIGLGSNLGDRRVLLRRALEELAKLGTLVAISALYETVPVGPPQPMFLNGAVALETSLTPLGLLEALLAVEMRLGRVRQERWGPRSIDLDILWSDAGVFASARLTVPHPELRKRAFALRPLLDVAPNARDPRDGTPYRAVLAALGDDSPMEIAGSRFDWT